MSASARAHNVSAALALLSDQERNLLAMMLHAGRQAAIGRSQGLGGFCGDDTDSITAHRELIDSIAGVNDPPNVMKSKPGPRDQWCPVCKHYHFKVGERTDNGHTTRPCPLLDPSDDRNKW